MDQFLDKYVFPYTGRFIGRARKTKDGFPIYSRGEDVFNTASHALGILMGIGMLICSILYHRCEMGLYGGVIFSVSMIILYTASSIYHGTSMGNVQEKKFFRILDHCSIFVLIAGTCTPFILNLIEHETDYYEWFFYGFFWLFAIGGITLLCVDMKKYKSISVVMYVIMGAMLILRADSLAEFLGESGTWLLLGGGAVYLAGLLFYGLGTRKRWMHSIFHVLCLVGSLLHCICIACYVI